MIQTYFYILTYLRFRVQELDFRCYGVVNGLVHGVFVPRHFFNDTNILYITNSMYSILGSHNWSVAHPFLQITSLLRGFRAGFSPFWGSKLTRSWGIGTKALPESYKHLIYNQCNVYKHLGDIIEESNINFYSLTFLRFGVSELDFWRSGVVNGLIHGVSVPRHFLNDQNILYIINAMYTNTWKS